MIFRNPNLNIMGAAAKKAARQLVRDFGEVENLQVSVKGVGDFVTAADLKAERSIVSELRKARPEYGFFLEEGGVIEGDGRHRWIVDPLDGTTNFMHGIPHFAISIALEREGEIVAGLIYQPISDEYFWADKGAGAHLNNNRLRVSARKKMEEAVITTGIPHQGRPGQDIFMPQLRAVMDNTAGVRRFGSAALDLAWVAAGRCDGFWEMGLKQWDMAAGILMVREAGGYVGGILENEDPMQSGNILAANAGLYEPLRKLLNSAA
jgi:myo-inositol-1(or 4)-monophosphatase